MMRRLIVIFVGFSVIIFNACAPPTQKAAQTTGANAVLSVQQQAALNVLTKNCASCHANGVSSGGIGYMTDLNKVAANLVVPGVPASSTLYNVVNSGQMPVTYKLAAADIQVIEDWIVSLAPSGGAAPVDSGPAGTFTQVNTIVTAKCVGCHNSSNQIPLTNYAQILAAVWPGNAAESSLYDAVNSGRMPASGSPLTPTELTTVRTWINAGALNN